jgi:hypothetical protein
MRAKKRGAWGERSVFAKLTERQVLEIRGSNESNALLAARYGMKPDSIAGIRNGRRWKNLGARNG